MTSKDKTPAENLVTIIVFMLPVFLIVGGLIQLFK